MIKTVELYESPAMERNQERYSNDENSCICCNKPTSPKTQKRVHMTTDWRAINKSFDETLQDGDTVHESQGFFPIGSECKKKMPAEFIFD